MYWFFCCCFFNLTNKKKQECLIFYSDLNVTNKFKTNKKSEKVSFDHELTQKALCTISLEK